MRIDRHAPQRGFTLLELVMAAALLVGMVGVVASLTSSGGDAQDYARRINRATELNQQLLDGMRLELVSCVRLFGNDAEGNGNLAVLDLAGAPPRLGGSLLPTLAPNSGIQVDTPSLQVTGNQLLFAKLAWSDRYDCASGRSYLVDVYRWVHYYLSPVDGGPQAGRAGGLDLVRVLGEPLADGAAIDAIADPVDRSEVLLHLVQATPDREGVTHAPCQVVWRRGGLATAAGTFRQIDESTGALSDDPIAGSGRPDPWQVLRAEAETEVQGLLAYRHHAVATVHAPPAFGATRFGVASLAGSGFPHGFEVQVVGPSSARQVLLHLVLASAQRRGQVAWSDLQLVADCREL